MKISPLLEVEEVEEVSPRRVLAHVQIQDSNPSARPLFLLFFPTEVSPSPGFVMSEFLEGLLGERLVNSEKAEVDVSSLGSRVSLLGLFFGCSLNAPCQQFNGSLCEFYSRFKKSSEHREQLEVVFISSDQEQKHWQDFLQQMPWPALPFKERHKKVRKRITGEASRPPMREGRCPLGRSEC